MSQQKGSVECVDLYMLGDFMVISPITHHPPCDLTMQSHPMRNLYLDSNWILHSGGICKAWQGVGTVSLFQLFLLHAGLSLFTHAVRSLQKCWIMMTRCSRAGSILLWPSSGHGVKVPHPWIHKETKQKTWYPLCWVWGGFGQTGRIWMIFVPTWSVPGVGESDSRIARVSEVIKTDPLTSVKETATYSGRSHLLTHTSGSTITRLQGKPGCLPPADHYVSRSFLNDTALNEGIVAST